MLPLYSSAACSEQELHHCLDSVLALPAISNSNWGILVEANSDLNLAGKDGATPLFVAAQILGRAKIFRSLACLSTSLSKCIMSKCQRSSKCVFFTTLMWFSPLTLVDRCQPQTATGLHRNGFLEIVQSLCEARANVEQVDEDGTSTVEIAQRSGHSLIESLLTCVAKKKSRCSRCLWCLTLKMRCYPQRLYMIVIYIYIWYCILLPVEPHKAVAEVSKIGNL